MNEYLDLVEEARKKQIKLTEEQYKYIRDLYVTAANNLKKNTARAPKGSLSERWLKDYRQAISQEIDELNKLLEGKITDNLLISANNAVGVQLNFFELLDNKYSLGISNSFRNMFSNVANDTIKELISGEFYKDGKGLSRRIWFNGKSVNGDIDYIVQQGIAQKKSAYELAKDVEMYVNPAARKTWDWKNVYPNTAKTIDYNAQRLARTAINHAHTLATLRSCEKNPFIQKVRWHSAFVPKRTCPLCIERDGKEYLLKDCPMDHPNGMCYQEPILDDSMEDIGKRLGAWVNGQEDNLLDSWYNQNEDSFSKDNNIFNKATDSNSENGGIIREKVVRSPEYKSNKQLIDSEEYENKFDSIVDKKVKASVIKETRSIIKKNDKKNTESMAFINEKGKAISRQDTGVFGGEIDISVIEDEAENSVILTHNHPGSTAFSDSDIALLLDKPQIETIIAAGHNGTVYMLDVGDGIRLETNNTLNENKVIQEYKRLYDILKDPNKVVESLAKKYNWNYEVK